MGSRLGSRVVFLRPIDASNASAAFHAQLRFSLLRPSVPASTSTGILTCLPSTTPFGLALGPDSPPMDEPCGGTLRFSGHWILTNVFVTQADILTSLPSTDAYARASPDRERSPTDFPTFERSQRAKLAKENPTASADRLVPAIIGARTLYQ